MTPPQNMNKMNIEKLIKSHGGKWVALNKDSSAVVVSSSKAKDVYKMAKKKGYKIPKLFKVPTKHLPYIG
jgi:hypothetical protein